MNFCRCLLAFTVEVKSLYKKTVFNSLYISLVIYETFTSGKTTKKTKNNGLRIKKNTFAERKQITRPCSVAKDVKLLYTWHYDSR